jgi:hypothetical protein
MREARLGTFMETVEVVVAGRRGGVSGEVRRWLRECEVAAVGRRGVVGGEGREGGCWWKSGPKVDADTLRRKAAGGPLGSGRRI